MCKVSKDRVLDNSLDDISNVLSDKKYAKNIMQYYWKAGLYSEQLIKVLLGAEGCKMPINIELLANRLGLKVKNADLNDYQDPEQRLSIPNKRIGQLVLRKNSYTNQEEKIIYTERTAPLPSKRFAVAYELSHYLFLRNSPVSGDLYESYFIMPMIPLEAKSLVIDIFAIFLLLPISQFFKEFSKFVKYSQSVPIATEDWIRYLSEKAVLPEFYASCGYQYLQNIGCWIYTGTHGRKEDIRAIGMTQALWKEIQKNTPYFDEEIVNLLFQ